MFIENIKHIQETEERAREIVEKARAEAKNLVKKNQDSALRMDREIKIKMQDYTDKKNNDAEIQAEQKIQELKLTNEELKKQIKNKALKKFDEVSQYIYEQLLLI
ncbi:MAG: hypothetical protein PHF84_03050 [bacterium]|nr:hypothetical protein [bacterium]